jgi:hypothetical protein
MNNEMSYPVMCEEKCYEAASDVLEDEADIFNHAACNELGLIIQAWLQRKRDNHEPRA